MMWGLYLWPCCDLGLGDLGRALARLRDLAEPALRIPRWISDARNAVATWWALLFEVFQDRGRTGESRRLKR